MQTSPPQQARCEKCAGCLPPRCFADRSVELACWRRGIGQNLVPPVLHRVQRHAELHAALEKLTSLLLQRRLASLKQLWRSSLLLKHRQRVRHRVLHAPLLEALVAAAVQVVVLLAASHGLEDRVERHDQLGAVVLVAKHDLQVHGPVVHDKHLVGAGVADLILEVEVLVLEERQQDLVALRSAVRHLVIAVPEGVRGRGQAGFLFSGHDFSPIGRPYWRYKYTISPAMAVVKINCQEFSCQKKLLVADRALAILALDGFKVAHKAAKVLPTNGLAVGKDGEGGRVAGEGCFGRQQNAERGSKGRLAKLTVCRQMRSRRL